MTKLASFPNSCTEGYYNAPPPQKGGPPSLHGQGQEKRIVLRATITTASVRLDRWADSRRLHRVHLGGNRIHHDAGGPWCSPEGWGQRPS